MSFTPIIAASRVRAGSGYEAYFPFNGGTEAELVIETVDGSPWKVDWGDGIIETHPSSASVVNKNYGSAFTGTVRIKGNVSYLQSDKGAFDWTNVSEFTSLTYLDLQSNSFTGDMSGVSNLTSLTDLWLQGNNLTGDMSGAFNLPSLTLLWLYGNFTVNYTSKSWASNMSGFLFRPSTATNPLDTIELDQLLIDLSQTNWVDYKAIYADFNNGVRSSASDAAVSTLQGMGVTLALNT